MAEVDQENAKSVISNKSGKKSEHSDKNKTVSVKSTKIGDEKPLSSKTEFHKKSFNSLKPIVGSEIVEVEIDDVKFYMEHSDEYRIQRGEKLIPYIIRMNERYKTKVESRIKQRKVKRGMFIFFVVFGAILAIIMVVYAFSYFKNKT